MPELIYSTMASLDGYIEDASGSFDWAAPDEELHAFANDLERTVGTHLFGRRMYETMVFWETAGLAEDDPEVVREFGSLWRGTDKIVVSRTLTAVSSARTRIVREFDAALVDELTQGSEADVAIGGAELAGHAFAAGVVDEIQLFVVPVIVGGGKRALPDDVTAPLRLLETRSFASGVVFTRYAVEH